MRQLGQRAQMCVEQLSYARIACCAYKSMAGSARHALTRQAAHQLSWLQWLRTCRLARAWAPWWRVPLL